ncbi:MAG: hypothetical protein JO345_28620 [Streptosporangiaceae bacterium]|nr:hypothetical protein [Streptosporangiaceae bacterium]
MLRRFPLLVASLILTTGSALAATTATAAQASTPSVNPGGVMQLSGQSGALASRTADPIHATQAQSTNWSGYAATSSTYTSVSASWTQPTAHCSSGQQFSSFWVGLDGFNSQSVEQTGSEADCSGSTPQYFAWYEMFPAFPVNYSNTVRPGDHMTASVTYLGSNRFSLHIADTTQGWSHTVPKSLAGAARSSAEVIVEAPSSSSGVLPLANFGTVSLSGSTDNGGAIGNDPGITEITMVNGSGQDKDTVSSLSGGENFSATWHRSN